MTKEQLFDKYAELCHFEETESEYLITKNDFIEATKSLYNQEDVHILMCRAFEGGYKKADVVEAGLESLNTHTECAWILEKYNKQNGR